MKKLSNILFYIISFTILFTSCETQNIALNNEEKIIVPSTYNGITNDTLTSAKMPWKLFFPDTLLQNYISVALSNNQSFHQISERMKQSSALLKQNNKYLLPEVNVGIGAGLTRYGEYTMDGIGNRETNVPSLAEDKHIPDPYRNFGLYVGFSWEADIWGKLSNKKKSALAQWMSSIEAVKLAQTVLVSEISKTYFELIALDKQVQVLKDAIDNNDKFINFTAILKEEGDETQLSVDRFISRKLLLEEKIYSVQQQVKQVELSLSNMLGIFPLTLKRSSFEDINKMDFPLAYGVPTQLLLLRPDVKAREYELNAAKADVNAARAAFYPSLIIDGNGGLNSFNLSKLFLTPASLVYDLAAGITAPIFNRKKIKYMWEISKSNQRIALSKYHETALKAYNEVAGLVSDNEYINKRITLKKEELIINKRSIKNANTLFRLYFIGYLDVLSVEEQHLTCELELIDLVIQNCIIHTNLYRAIGGGYGEY